MSYNITCSTRILNLALTPVLFMLVGVLCEFAMLLDVYILLSSAEEEVYSSSWGNIYFYLGAYISQSLDPLSSIILLCLGNISLYLK